MIGDRQAYLTALVGIEYDTVADWASRRKLEFTTYRDLSEKPEVVSLVTDAIKDVNSRFARVKRSASSACSRRNSTTRMAN